MVLPITKERFRTLVDSQLEMQSCLDGSCIGCRLIKLITTDMSDLENTELLACFVHSSARARHGQLPGSHDLMAFVPLFVNLVTLGYRLRDIELLEEMHTTEREIK